MSSIGGRSRRKALIESESVVLMAPEPHLGRFAGRARDVVPGFDFFFAG